MICRYPRGQVIQPTRQITSELHVDAVVGALLVKFSHSPILHYAFSSRIEKTMTKTTHCHWENRFVLQWYGAVRKFYRLVLHVSDTVGK